MTPWDMVVTPMGLRFQGRVFPCTLGRGGVTTGKRESDGATPAGVHRLVGCLYRPDRLSRPCDWAVPIRPFDLWSDDPGHEDYNLMVRAPYPWSHERLARADRQYDIVLITDWNWPRAERGAGSAIFVHAWRGPGQPTAGCVAMAAGDLRWIVRRIRHRTRLIVPEGLARMAG
ncbi:MAG: L,D-transpeptidase family protein [Rhodobacteraceae bacterium]|nr:L,D-transpeptidase family protein [Paracoccaceae bacterium]